MPSATTQFFEHLGTRGHVAELEKVRGTLRFEVEDAEPIERWLVTVDHGAITVAPDAGAETPTCVVRGTRVVLEGVARGELNAMAAVLRGELVIEGDLQILMIVQRVFPGPPGTMHPTARIKPAGRE
jgi:putative sterol carrier protein